jgi:hypothetical protein
MPAARVGNEGATLRHGAATPATAIAHSHAHTHARNHSHDLTRTHKKHHAQSTQTTRKRDEPHTLKLADGSQPASPGMTCV